MVVPRDTLFLESMWRVFSGGKLMSTEANLRRDFLRLAGAGVNGVDLKSKADQGPAPPAASSPAAASFDVRTFGATGDVKTLDTAAINKTIDAAAAAGGGTEIGRAH